MAAVRSRSAQIYYVQCYLVLPNAVRLLAMVVLHFVLRTFLSWQSLISIVQVCLGFIPVMALHFLHGVYGVVVFLPSVPLHIALYFMLALP